MPANNFKYCILFYLFSKSYYYLKIVKINLWINLKYYIQKQKFIIKKPKFNYRIYHINNCFKKIEEIIKEKKGFKIKYVKYK